MELFCSIIDLVNYLPSLKQEVETIFSNAYFYYIIARKDPDMKKRALAVLLAFSMVFCNTGYLYAAEEGDAAGEIQEEVSDGETQEEVSAENKQEEPSVGDTQEGGSAPEVEKDDLRAPEEDPDPEKQEDQGAEPVVQQDYAPGDAQNSAAGALGDTFDLSGEDGQALPELILVGDPSPHTAFHVGFEYDANSFVRWSTEPEDPDAAAITWSSSRPELADIGEDGRFLAEKPGIVTVSASAYGGAVTASVDIVIYGELRLTDFFEIYYIGDEEDLTWAYFWDDSIYGEDRSVNWSVSDPEVASLDGNTLTFVGAGEVVLTVSSEDGAVSDSTTMTVEEGNIVRGDYWTMDLTHERLTISGITEMPDFASAGKAPWDRYRDDIFSVVVADGVEHIGSNSFCDCWNLYTASLPASLRSIGADAFFRCPRLESADIPDSVTVIGKRAFKDCWGLQEIHLPASLRELGDSALAGCTDLEGIILPAGTRELGIDAIAAQSVKYVILPAGLESVGGTDLCGNEYEQVSLFYGGSETQFRDLFSGMIEAQSGTSRPFFDRYKVFYDLSDGPLMTESIEVTIPEELASEDGLEIMEWESADLDVAILPDNATVHDPESLKIKNESGTAFADDVYWGTLLTDAKWADGKLRVKGKMAGTDGGIILSAMDGSGISRRIPVNVLPNPAYDNYKYNIAFKANGGSGTMSNKTGIGYRRRIYLPYNKFTRKGYTFSAWSLTPNNSDSWVDQIYNGDTVMSLTNVNGGTVNLYAIWDPISYDINYKLNGGVNSATNPGWYTIEDAVSLKAPTRENYTFLGWYSDAKFKNKVTAIKKGSTGNRTFYAKWAKNKYKITFLKNGATGGKMADMTGITYDARKTLTANAYTRKGYRFTGWNTEPDGTGTAYTNKQSIQGLSHTNGDVIRLYAQWQIIDYRITYTLNGGTNSEENPATYQVITDTITLQKPTRTGYTFNGWYSDKKFKTRVTAIKKSSTGNKTLYAKWTANKYTVIFNRNDASYPNAPAAKGTMKNMTATYNGSQKLTKNAFTRKGYTFTGWNTVPVPTEEEPGFARANNAKAANLTSDPGAKVTLYAQWKLTNYKINYNVTADVDNSMNPATYTVDDETFEIQAPVRPGYDFAGWYADAKFKKKANLTIALGSTGNKTFYPRWTAHKYKVTFVNNDESYPETEASTGTMKVQTLTYGSSTKLTANAFKKKHYTMIGWNELPDGSGRSFKNQMAKPNVTTVKDGEVTLYAQWAPTNYKITYNKNGGTLSGDYKKTFTYFEVEEATLTLPIPTRRGYTFQGWYTNSKFTAASRIKEIAVGTDKNVTVYAKWKKK